MKENRCVICGQIIPEGVMVCPSCENCHANVIETVVNIDTIDKAKEFCNLCSKCNNEVLVYSGRYIVSGKSIKDI